MDKTKDICEMKDMLTSWLKTHLSSGAQCVETDEAKKCAEIIGYLADIEKDCYETAYYKAVVEAMENGAEEGPYGYNNRRYSSGRYAPKGRGNVMGYRPYMDQEPYIEGYLNDPNFKENMRMGYSDNGTYGSGMNGGSGHMRYGMSYNQYKTAKRHYHETNDDTARSKMNDHIDEHLNDSIMTLKEMWKDADQNHKKRMKDDLMALVQQMN